MKITFDGSNKFSPKEANQFQEAAGLAYRGHSIGQDPAGNFTITKVKQATASANANSNSNKVASSTPKAPASMHFGMPGVAPQAGSSGPKIS